MKRIVVLLALVLGIVACAESAPATLTLLCTAPCNDSTARVGDADCGRCLEYDLRVATDSMSLINNWSTCTRITMGIPSVAGQDDSVKITNHVKNSYRYYAIKASDGIAWSAISNICTIFIPRVPGKPANIRSRITF